MFGDDRQDLPKDGDRPKIPYRELYPIKEAAILLGVSETTAYRKADTGELPTKWFGGRRQVPRAQLMELIANLPAGETKRRPRRQAAAEPDQETSAPELDGAVGVSACVSDTRTTARERSKQEPRARRPRTGDPITGLRAGLAPSG